METRGLSFFSSLVLLLFICVSFLAVASVSQLQAATSYSPLLQVLIRKGIITEQEAAEIEAEAAQIQQEQKEQMAREIRKEAVPRPLRGLKFRMLSYLDYSAGEEGEPGGGQKSWNRFTIKRAYFRVDKDITPWLHAHMTFDAHQDDSGDWKNRLKYLYALFRLPDLGPVTDIKSEAGLGHIPWLDFEEHVNPYRCQGTMAIERAHVFNSADMGVSVMGNLGGRLDDAEHLIGSHHYDGRWGSWHLGVYNGGGYHADEHNGNKVVEGRLTIRPLPDMIPGLQFSYFGLYGEGNNQAEDALRNSDGYPDYRVHLGMMSYQSPRLILTAQYFTSRGNKDGSWYDDDGDALDTEGYSFFVNFRPPLAGFSGDWDRRLNLFARFDHFDADRDEEMADDADYDLYIVGSALEIFRGNYILAAYEHYDYGEDYNGKRRPKEDNDLGDEHKFQLVYQLKF